MYKDRVKDTSTTTGTGNFTLSGSAPAGFIPFDTAFGHAGNTFYYCIEDGTNWEVGEGTLTDAVTFARTTVLASSNAGALENFPSGTKNVFSTIPAAKVVTNTAAANAIPVSDGTNLVASQITDDGSAIYANPSTLVVEASSSVTLLGGSTAGAEIGGDTSSLGDALGNGNGTRMVVTDSTHEIKLRTAGADLVLVLETLPTSDPSNPGQLWNDSGTLKIS